MSKVYITKASTKLIFKGLKKVQDKIAREDIINELESDFTGFARLNIEHKGGFGRYFNLRELRALYKMKMVFKDLPKLIEDMNYNKSLIAQYISSENYKFAKKVKAPSYHIEKACLWLNSNFTNIELPRAVKDENERELMRNFVNAHTHKTFEETNILFKIEFQTIENLIEVNLNNSGVESFNNMEIATKVNLIFGEMHTLLHSGENNTVNKNINKIVYADAWKKNDICKNSLLSEEDCREMQKFLQTKQDLTDMLFSFYQEKYNSDLSFEGQLLDSIGFGACRGCRNQVEQKAA
jgi:hypothetical protein